MRNIILIFSSICMPMVIGIALIMYLQFLLTFQVIDDWKILVTEEIKSSEKEKLYNICLTNKIIAESRFQGIAIDSQILTNFYFKVKQGIVIEQPLTQFQACHTRRFQKKDGSCSPDLYLQHAKSINLIDLWFHRTIQTKEELSPLDSLRLSQNLVFMTLAKAIYSIRKTEQLDEQWIYNSYDSSLISGSPATMFQLNATYQTCKGLNYTEPYDPRCRPWYILGESSDIVVFQKPYVYSSNSKIGMTAIRKQVDPITLEQESILSIDFGISNFSDQILRPQETYDDSSIFEGYSVFFHEDKNTVFSHKYWNRTKSVESWQDIEFNSTTSFSLEQKQQFEEVVSLAIADSKHIDFNSFDSINNSRQFINYSKNSKDYLALIIPIKVSSLNDVTKKYEMNPVMYIARVQMNVIKKIIADIDSPTQFLQAMTFIESTFLLLLMTVCLLNYMLMLINQIEKPISKMTKFLKHSHHLITEKKYNNNNNHRESPPVVVTTAHANTYKVQNLTSQPEILLTDGNRSPRNSPSIQSLFISKLSCIITCIPKRIRSRYSNFFDTLQGFPNHSQLRAITTNFQRNIKRQKQHIFVSIPSIGSISNKNTLKQEYTLNQQNKNFNTNSDLISRKLGGVGVETITHPLTKIDSPKSRLITNPALRTTDGFGNIASTATVVAHEATQNKPKTRTNRDPIEEADYISADKQPNHYYTTGSPSSPVYHTRNNSVTSPVQNLTNRFSFFKERILTTAHSPNHLINSNSNTPNNQQEFRRFNSSSSSVSGAQQMHTIPNNYHNQNQFQSNNNNSYNQPFSNRNCSQSFSYHSFSQRNREKTVLNSSFGTHNSNNPAAMMHAQYPNQQQANNMSYLQQKQTTKTIQRTHSNSEQSHNSQLDLFNSIDSSFLEIEIIKETFLHLSKIISFQRSGFFQDDEIAESLMQFSQAHETFAKIKNDYALALCLLNIARLHAKAYHFQEAIQNYSQSIDIALNYAGFSCLIDFESALDIGGIPSDSLFLKLLRDAIRHQAIAYKQLIQQQIFLVRYEFSSQISTAAAAKSTSPELLTDEELQTLIKHALDILRISQKYEHRYPPNRRIMQLMNECEIAELLIYSGNLRKSKEITNKIQDDLYDLENANSKTTEFPYTTQTQQILLFNSKNHPISSAQQHNSTPSKSEITTATTTTIDAFSQIISMRLLFIRAIRNLQKSNATSVTRDSKVGVLLTRIIEESVLHDSSIYSISLRLLRSIFEKHSLALGLKMLSNHMSKTMLPHSCQLSQNMKYPEFDVVFLFESSLDYSNIQRKLAYEQMRFLRWLYKQFLNKHTDRLAIAEYSLKQSKPFSLLFALSNISPKYNIQKVIQNYYNFGDKIYSKEYLQEQQQQQKLTSSQKQSNQEFNMKHCLKQTLHLLHSNESVPSTQCQKHREKIIIQFVSNSHIQKMCDSHSFQQVIEESAKELNITDHCKIYQINLIQSSKHFESIQKATKSIDFIFDGSKHSSESRLKKFNSSKLLLEAINSEKQQIEREEAEQQQVNMQQLENNIQLEFTEDNSQNNLPFQQKRTPFNSITNIKQYSTVALCKLSLLKKRIHKHHSFEIQP